MKIIQVISENASSAAQLKSAFTREEWARIIYHFLSQIRGGSRAGTGSALTANLANAFEKIGPDMPDTTTAGDWNSTAQRFGAMINSATPTFPAIYQHLAPHKNAQLPADFDINNIPGSGRTTYRTDVDRTGESLQTVSAWVEGPANMNREQVSNYFRQWIEKLTEVRGEDYVNNIEPQFARSMVRLQDELLPAEGQTVAKTAVDSRLYAWLTAVDQRLN